MKITYSWVNGKVETGRQKGKKSMRLIRVQNAPYAALHCSHTHKRRILEEDASTEIKTSVSSKFFLPILIGMQGWNVIAIIVRIMVTKIR